MAPTVSKGGTIMNYDNMTAVKCEGECSNPVEMPLAQTLNEATLMASQITILLILKI